MVSVAGAVLSLLLGVTCARLAWSEVRRSREFVTPYTILLIFALLDVYLSAAKYFVFRDILVPPWMLPLKSMDILSGMLWFTVGTSLLLLGMRWTTTRHGRVMPEGELLTLAGLRVRIGRVYVCFIAALSLYVGTLLKEVHSAGSFSAFIHRQSLSRYSPSSINTSFSSTGGLLYGYLNGSALLLLFMLAGILFFLRVRYRRRVLWGFAFPVVAWICALATFYRGYQLTLFLMLLGLETIRVRSERVAQETGRGPEGGRYLTGRRMRGLLAAPIIFFLAYGGLRTALQAGSQTKTPTNPLSAIANQVGDLTIGGSLIGMSEIIKVYPWPSGSKNTGYIYGSTIEGAVLLPLPRIFWPSKPRVAGFLALNGDLNWLTSTQSAVSWSGEFWANFGPVGLLLLLPVGCLIGLAYTYHLRPRLLFVYFTTLIPGIMISHWMSILGLVNTVIYAPLFYFVARLVLQTGPRVPERHEGRTNRDGPKFSALDSSG